MPPAAKGDDPLWNPRNGLFETELKLKAAETTAQLLQDTADVLVASNQLDQAPMECCAPESTQSLVAPKVQPGPLPNRPAAPRHASAIFPAHGRVALEVLKDALLTGESASLPGIGIFSVQQHPARQGRNPRTGEIIQIPAKARVHFKAAKQLLSKINGQ